MTLDDLPIDPVLPAIGRPDPLANGLKTGTPADCPRVPEDGPAVFRRAGEWYMDFRPQNLYHAWLVDQIAVTSLRIEHLGRVDRRARDRAVIHAELFWDDDRRLAAEELGDRLKIDPARAVDQLRRTPQGCDWMIARWARLARIADVEGRWDAAQTSIAFDLLGARPEERSGEPGEAIDALGRPVNSPDRLAALARREVAALQDRKAEVAPLDAADRTMARADYVNRPTPGLRELRRHDAELHRRLRWYLAQINGQSPYKFTRPGVDPYFLRNVVLPTEPAAPEAVAPPAEVAAEDAMVLPNRVQSKLKKAEARKESRRRKLERLRA